MNETIEQQDSQKYLAAINQAKTRFNEIISQTGNKVAFAEESIHAMMSCEANYKLMAAAQQSPESLRNAIFNVASVGLSLNRATSYAYLVPRGRKINNQWVNEVCLDISYRGLLKIATDTGSIRWAKAEVVYSNDSFTMREMGVQPEHSFDPFSERGEPVGVYCVAKTSDGDFLADAMNMDEIEKIREKSEGKDSGFSPWKTYPHEMWKKAVIKRASKSWPKTERSERLQQAIEVVNEHQGIEFQQHYTPEQFSYYQNTIKGDGLPLEHFIFIRTMDIETSNSLSHTHISSIAKGAKGQPGRGAERERILEIFNKGQSQYFDIVTILNESVDEFRIQETLDCLPNGGWEYIQDDLSPEALARITEMKIAA